MQRVFFQFVGLSYSPKDLPIILLGVWVCRSIVKLGLAKDQTVFANSAANSERGEAQERKEEKRKEGREGGRKEERKKLKSTNTDESMFQVLGSEEPIF